MEPKFDIFHKFLSPGGHKKLSELESIKKMYLADFLADNRPSMSKLQFCPKVAFVHQFCTKSTKLRVTPYETFFCIRGRSLELAALLLKRGIFLRSWSGRSKLSKTSKFLCRNDKSGHNHFMTFFVIFT